VRTADGVDHPLRRRDLVVDGVDRGGDIMFPVERFRFIQEVIRQVTVFPDKVKIEYNTEGLKQTMRNAGEDAR